MVQRMELLQQWSIPCNKEAPIRLPASSETLLSATHQAQWKKFVKGTFLKICPRQLAGRSVCLTRGVRSETRVLEQCPKNLLKEPNAELLNYWLSRFVVEARREDSEPYPPTLINILSGLYCFSKSSIPTGVICPNFMNRKDPRFRNLTSIIQVRYCELRTNGVGAIVKHAAVVTSEEEDLLWNSKVLGVHSPLALVHAVFF